MRDAVIVAAVRTPIGKRGGGLARIHPVDLSALVIRTAVDRAGVDAGLVEDVIWGCVSQVGEQASDIGRSAALAAGLPETVTGVTVDRQCGSSQQALHFAAAVVMAGQCDVVIAGGVESMTRIPMGTSSSIAGTPWTSNGWKHRYGDAVPSQGLAAEMVAEKWGLARAELDEYALLSHLRAAASQATGCFDEEIVEVGEQAADEGVRADCSSPALAALRPAFCEGGKVTAGNSSQISDGAAAVAVTTSDFARSHGLRPLGRIHTAVLAGADPITMLTAPIPATARALARSGLSLDDIGTFEVNEAFASVPLAWMAATGARADRVNPSGGAIALGHPLGASGARLLTTMLHRMRRGGIRYGLQAMCEGGGQANATIIETAST